MLLHPFWFRRENNMIYILNKNEEIVGVLSNNGYASQVTPFWDDVHSLDLDNGSESYEFTTLGDSPEASYLEVGNYIAFDFNGEVKLFAIVDIEDNHTDVFNKTVYTESCGLELLNSYVRPVSMVGVNIKSFMDSILADTPFKLGNVSLSLTALEDVEIDKHTSVYALIQDIAIGKFGAEVSFRVKIVNNRIVARYVDLYTQRGARDLHRFEYGFNMSGVTRKVDSTEVCTALIGVGADNIDIKSVEAEDKPLDQDFIVNQEAFERFNVRGNHIFGVFECDANSPHELLLLTREESIKRSTPKITYDLSLEMLGEQVGLGDTVYIIDNTFNPPLHLEARVQKLELSQSDPTSNNCTLTNFKEVSSNITDEMRAMADKLVYISNKFEGTAEELKDKIQSIQVGGRNLLLDSVRKVTNNNHPTAIFTLSQLEPYEEGADYTITIKGQLGERKRAWQVCNSGGVTELCQLTPEDRKPDGRYVKTFKWIKGKDAFINIYPISTSIDTESTIDWVKLEYGNVASAHSYAQEDLDQVVEDKLNNTETILNQNIDNAIQDSQKEILNNVAENYADRVTITEMQSGISSQILQTNQMVELNFNRVNDYTVKVGDELNKYKEEVKTHIRFSENGMELGQINSPFTASLDNKKLAFLENDKEVAYISNNKMHITQAEIGHSLKIGNVEQGFFTWQEGANGNLSLKWSRA